MKVDILKISDGEESIVIRYREMTPSVNKIISILQNEKTKIWGKWGNRVEIFHKKLGNGIFSYRLSFQVY